MQAFFRTPRVKKGDRNDKESLSLDIVLKEA